MFLSVPKLMLFFLFLLSVLSVLIILKDLVKPASVFASRMLALKSTFYFQSDPLNTDCKQRFLLLSHHLCNALLFVWSLWSLTLDCVIICLWSMF